MIKKSYVVTIQGEVVPVLVTGPGAQRGRVGGRVEWTTPDWNPEELQNMGIAINTALRDIRVGSFQEMADRLMSTVVDLLPDREITVMVAGHRLEYSPEGANSDL